MLGSRHPSLLFAAMSGVRVHDAELLATGLTLPGFVERSRVIASLPSLGLLTLAARTPEEWPVAYREFDELPPDAAQAIAAEGFALVAVSSLTARINETYAFCDQLRAAGVAVVLGGLHASALPDEASAHADAVVVGEGERVWADLLADFRADRLRSRYDSASLPPSDFFHREQPVPRYDLLDPARYNRLTLQTARGCPLHCSFCAASRTISPYRRKDIAQVQRELESIVAVWPEPFIELADDNTFVDKRWGLRLAELLGEYPLRWFTESDISVADDPALLRALARSGCSQILIGLESANAASMVDLDTRNWKAGRHAVVRERVRTIQDHGISVNGCFILGFDEDGPEVFDRTLDYIDSLDLAEVQITLLTPFPGTSLRASLIREGRFLEDDCWERYTLFDTTHHPARMPVEALRSGFHRLMREVYSEQRVSRRRKAFRQCVRRARAATPSSPGSDDESALCP